MKKIILLLIILIYKSSFGQTATIKLRKIFPNKRETENPLKFEFNGQVFGEKDTIIQIQINKVGFDYCKVTSNKSSFYFLTKFKENEIYEIKQGCCCADFTLEAEKNPKRGIVIFKNKTNRNLGLIVAEHEFDTVKTGKKNNFCL